jgi:hypothetical protein
LTGILPTGDLFVWNKDLNQIYNVNGLPEFCYKLGFHSPKLYISDDARKIILVTSRNKVFVWQSETNKPNSFENSGTWHDIVVSKDIKNVEDNKELVVDVRFLSNPVRSLKITN